MMAKKDRFPEGYSARFAPNYESEGSGCSGRVDMEITASEDSSAPWRKSITLNSASHDDFGVPLQVLPLSKLSPSERKNLVLCLRAELEKIRVLQKKAELQKTNFATVSSTSDILSCRNAQNVSLVGNSRKSSGLIYRPGKKLNPPSYKGCHSNRGTSGRFEPAIQPSAQSTSNAILMKQCENLLKKLMSHQYGWVFKSPVDVVELNIPDYFTVIKHPMDLGTIKRKIASCEYSSPLNFLADVRLTFSNAMTYNPPGNDVHIMADTLSKFFEVRCKVIEKKLTVNDSKPLLEDSGLHGEMDMLKPLPPSKKRKITSKRYRVLPEPVKRTMTDEEKHNLSRELEALLGDFPDKIIEFLRQQSSHGKEAGEDEIEIDIEELSDDTLFTLRKLLDDHLQEKKNHAEAEPCEIELLNESGLSTSSLQLYKGNGLVDDDVDIGGNEPPVSSYPPVEIDKDTSRRSNGHIKSGSSRDSDSSSSSDSELDVTKTSSPLKLSKENSGPGANIDEKEAIGNLVDGNQSVSGLDQLEQVSLQKPNSVESDCFQDGEGAPTERQVSPEKRYRAALLKIRFADTILKAREKTLNQGEKGNSEKQRREKEALELQKRKEKARLQAEAKAAEDAQRRAEAEAAAEAKQRRELEREAARQALLKMEKTVEINENSRFLEDLEMLRGVPSEQLMSCVDETSPDHSENGLGSFKFGGSNPLEQLGLYMKVDEEEEEVEPPGVPNVVNDVEEGEIE